MKEKIYFEDNKLFGFLYEDKTVWNEKGERIAYLWNELVYSRDGNLIGSLEKNRLVIKSNRTHSLSAVSKLEKLGNSYSPTTPKIERTKRSRE